MEDVLKWLKLITIVNTIKYIDNDDTNAASKANEETTRGIIFRSNF